MPGCGQAARGRNPFERKPEASRRLWELGQEPRGARRGCSAGGRAWGRGRQRPEGQRDGPARAWGHVLLCQGDRFWVGRGDHEADPGGADGVSSAVGHFPKVSAVLVQGVVGSAADLALGDRNRSQQHGRNHRPLQQDRHTPSPAPGFSRSLPLARNSCACSSLPAACRHQAMPLATATASEFPLGQR